MILVNQAFGLSMRCRTFVSGWRIVGTVLTIDSINDLWTAWEKQNSTQLQSEIAAFWIGEAKFPDCDTPRFTPLILNGGLCYDYLFCHTIQGSNLLCSLICVQVQ